MTGLNEFLKLFGGITLLDVAQFVLAIIFIVFAYKKFRDYLIDKHDVERKREAADKERDTKLAEALDAVRKYPEYRQQSVKIQQGLEAQIKGLSDVQVRMAARLDQMEEATQRRERNKIRDRLLQNYRHYTNPETNPTHSWTRMEAEAFWELFKDYENAGGNGYVHSVVQPAMEELTIIEVGVTHIP